MDSSKWIAKSMTFWGGVVATAPVWIKALGVDISDSEFKLIADFGNQAIALAGFVLVFIGRKRAKDSVTLTPK